MSSVINLLDLARHCSTYGIVLFTGPSLDRDGRCADPLLIAPIWAWSVLWYCIVFFPHSSLPARLLYAYFGSVDVRVIIVQRFEVVRLCDFKSA